MDSEVQVVETAATPHQAPFDRGGGGGGGSTLAQGPSKERLGSESTLRTWASSHCGC